MGGDSNLIIDSVDPTKSIYSIYKFQGTTIAIGNEDQILNLISQNLHNLCDENGTPTNSNDFQDTNLVALVGKGVSDINKKYCFENSFLRFTAYKKNKQK